MNVLAERGFKQTNLDVIARRACAGKAAVHRRWTGLGDLIEEALTAEPRVPTPPDTGFLRTDLLVVLEPLGRTLDGPDTATASLIGFDRHGPDIVQTLDRAIVTPLATAVDTVLDAHASRGSPDEPAARKTVHRLVRALWWAHLVDGVPLTSADIDELIVVIEAAVSCGPRCTADPPRDPAAHDESVLDELDHRRHRIPRAPDLPTPPGGLHTPGISDREQHRAATEGAP